MNPQYVYTGKYREFRGYVFANGNPVTILDRGTLEAIVKDDSFKLVPQPVQPEPEPQPIVEPEQVEYSDMDASADGCPKCGKVILRGRYMHEKYCKG